MSVRSIGALAMGLALAGVGCDHGGVTPDRAPTTGPAT